MNISCLIVEIDAKVVVDVFKNPNYVNHVISSILGDCKQLASQIQRIQFSHCYRQANWYVDMLARISAGQEFNFIMFNSPPVDFFNAFEDDFVGLHFNMLFPELDVAI